MNTKIYQTYTLDKEKVKLQVEDITNTKEVFDFLMSIKFMKLKSFSDFFKITSTSDDGFIELFNKFSTFYTNEFESIKRLIAFNQTVIFKNFTFTNYMNDKKYSKDYVDMITYTYKHIIENYFSKTFNYDSHLNYVYNLTNSIVLLLLDLKLYNDFKVTDNEMFYITKENYMFIDYFIKGHIPYPNKLFMLYEKSDVDISKKRDEISKEFLSSYNKIKHLTMS